MTYWTGIIQELGYIWLQRHGDPTLIAVLEEAQEAFNMMCLITTAIIVPLKQICFPTTKS